MNFRRNGRRKTLGSWRNIPCCPIRTLLLPPGKSPASPQRRRNLGPNRAWKARSVREAQPMKDLDDSRAPLLDHLIELRRRLLYCVGMLLASFAVCMYFADDIFGILVRPLAEAFGPGQEIGRAHV